jgi:hypothetical protein
MQRPASAAYRFDWKREHLSFQTLTRRLAVNSSIPGLHVTPAGCALVRYRKCVFDSEQHSGLPMRVRNDAVFIAIADHIQPSTARIE